MKISLLEPLAVPAKVIEGLSAGLKEKGHEFVYYDTKTTDAEELLARTGDSEVIMIANNPLPGSVTDSAPNLKMISVAFTGYDHLDMQSCRKRGITVSNCAGYSNETVAELVIGMAVAAYRKMTLADSIIRKGGTSAGIGGREIAGRPVGIIGLGRIGFRVAELFRAFGAEVVAFSRHENEAAKAMGVRYVSLEELLRCADIVSINLPMNDETRGFLSRERIAMMRKDAVLINCARGPIVDNRALADALNEDRIAFACVDVFDMEPPIPEEYPLLHAKNTFLTPHQAYISEEAMVRRAKIAFDNVYAYLDGAPVNVCK